MKASADCSTRSAPNCERVKALDGPFIIERYWQGRWSARLNGALQGNVDEMPELSLRGAW